MLAPRLLEGLRILVVEDNLLLAEVTKLLLEDSGCQVVGPAGWLQRGLELAEHEPLDGALLDINLNGRLCFPICDVLVRRAIPFCFVTGYSHLDLIPGQYREAPVIAKPFDPERLRSVIDNMLRGRQADHALPPAAAFAKSTRPPS